MKQIRGILGLFFPMKQPDGSWACTIAVAGIPFGWIMAAISAVVSGVR